MIVARFVPFARVGLIVAVLAGCDGSNGRRDAGDAAVVTDAAGEGDHSPNSIGDAMPDRTSATDIAVAVDAPADDVAPSDAGQEVGSDVQGDATTPDALSDSGAGGGASAGGGRPGQGGSGASGGIAGGGSGGSASGGSASGGSGSGGTTGSGGSAGRASGGAAGSASGGAAGAAASGGSAGSGTAGSASGGSGGGTGGVVGTGGAGAAAASLYLVTASTATQPTVFIATDLSLIDTIQGRVVRQVTLLGTTAIAYRNGALLTAQAAGYTRITALDPDTLNVVRVQTLAWDPGPAVFSADGRYLYAAHGDGYVAQVRVSDGLVTAEIRIPPPPGGMDPSDIGGLAIDPTEGFLGVTSVHAGTGSSVALVRVSGQTLTLANNWLSQPFPSSNCTRYAEYPAFDRASTRLVVSDRNCTAFDVYSLTTGLLDPTASVMFERDGGISAYSTTLVDERGQIWATNYESIYRASIVDPLRQKRISFGPDPGGLSIDSTGRIIYALQNDPRANGIFRVDGETGALTRQGWNLDLVPFGSVVVTSALVDRAPPAQ